MEVGSIESIGGHGRGFLYLSQHLSHRPSRRCEWGELVTTIANIVHIPSIAQEGDIWSPIHRLIHYFIPSTINMRKDADKVPNLDIFFLWCILTPGVFCNIPFFMKKYLAERVDKDIKGALICGGMLVTKLARSYGLFERRVTKFLTLMPTRHFNILLYKRATIV